MNHNGIHTHFIDNTKTPNHHSIIYGIRELTLIEMEQFCFDKTFSEHRPIIDEPAMFSSNYEILIYQSGCFYLDSNHHWQSHGLVVGT